MPPDRFQTVVLFRAALDFPPEEQHSVILLPPPASQAATIKTHPSQDPVELGPYEPLPGFSTAGSKQLLEVQTYCWGAVAKHLAASHLSAWLRSGVGELWLNRKHGLADELEEIASPAEGLGKRISHGDQTEGSFGLQELGKRRQHKRRYWWLPGTVRSCAMRGRGR